MYKKKDIEFIDDMVSKLLIISSHIEELDQIYTPLTSDRGCGLFKAGEFIDEILASMVADEIIIDELSEYEKTMMSRMMLKIMRNRHQKFFYNL